MRIVHLGPGNFFRAHTAWFTAHAGDAADWSIEAFAGRSGSSVDSLRGLTYPLVVRGADGDRRESISVISAVSADLADWTAWFADPSLALVTATVTEAGWAARGPGSTSARLADGLAARHAAGLSGIAIVPCDNLAANGHAARAAVAAAVTDPALAAWIDAEVSFVSTLVDRITPRPAPEERADDPALVVTEPYAEWVLAGAFPAGRPRWEDAGARFVDDVTPFEERKLWLLNGAHSLLAYAGSARGHATVAEAIADPVVRGWVEQWWDECRAVLAAAFEPAALDAYCADLLDRFGNPRIRHLLAQIAADGSQKLPQRVLPVLRASRTSGRPFDGAARILAAWVAHLRGAGAPVVDVEAERVVPAAAAGTGEVLALLGLDDPRVVEAVDGLLRTG